MIRLFGGVNNESVLDMRKGHTHFVATLTVLGFLEEDIGKVVAMAVSVKDDVLNK